MAQLYEDYWKITLEYSDINGERFRGTLGIIVDFINKKGKKPYSKGLYEELQKKVYEKYPKEDMASVRKSINQFVKLGFISYQLESYHEDTISFLEARTSRRRQSIFSKIVYTNSSFNRDVTKNSDKHEINFLIKTLEEVGKLSAEDIASLMTIEINSIKKGYLTKEELAKAKQNAEKIKFLERKYNQASHFRSILNNLDDLMFIKNDLYFEEDAKDEFEEYLRKKKEGRDPYLYRIYKNQLKEESTEKLGRIDCMLEYLDYPSLVASHLKPFIDSSNREAYDPDNGLLLSRNMDVLLDSGHISFRDDGKILLSHKLSKDLQNHLKSYILKRVFLTAKRLIYLKYHRTKVFQK